VQYIRFVADRLLVALGYDKHYGVRNPFDWMELISLQVRASSWGKHHALPSASFVLAAVASHLMGSCSKH
jgi:hypothetical protein